jgi:hypothetical protein
MVPAVLNTKMLLLGKDEKERFRVVSFNRRIEYFPRVKSVNAFLCNLIKLLVPDRHQHFSV